MTDKDNKENENIEQEIKDTIDRLKEKDKYPKPKKEYDFKKEDPIEQKPTQNIYLPSILIILVAIIGISAMTITSISVINKLVTYPIEEKTQTKRENPSIINDIEFNILENKLEEGFLELDLRVKNNGKRDFYTTIRGIYLINKEGDIITPNVQKGDIPVNLFGKKITPNTEERAKIVFEDIKKDENYYLVIKNVSDAHHFIWDYIITIPN